MKLSRHGAAVVLLAMMLTACQTTGHRFSQSQEAVLQANGFVNADDGWELSLADRLLFDTNSDSLKPGMDENLNRVTASLLRVGISRARIEGHTDSTGTAAYNRALSIGRARAVASILQASGIPGTNLTLRGWGEAHPISDNKTAEGRALNRRVVIIVTPE